MAKPVEKKGELAPAEGGPPALVVKPATTSITIHAPAEVEVLEDEDITSDTGLASVAPVGTERRVPIHRILQVGSPQCLPVENGGIPGAKAGTIFNTQTKQIYDGRRGLFFIPCDHHLKFVEFIKREDDGSGGGFLGIHEPDSPEVTEGRKARLELYGNLLGPYPFGQTENGKDKELVETYYVNGICIVPNDEGRFPGEFGRSFQGSFAFSSSNISVYNAWLDQVKTYKYNVRDKSNNNEIVSMPIALWSHVYLLQTALKTRGKQNWMIWSVSLGERDEKGLPVEDYKRSRLPRTHSLYKEAERFREELLEGRVELDFTKDSADAAERGAPADRNAPNNDIPFEQS